MSDNLRMYRAIRDALTQCYPCHPSCTFAMHLITLAALIIGIVGSKSAHLPHIAAKVPNGTKPEIRVKRFARWSRQRLYPGGCVLSALCGCLAASSRLADIGARYGWHRRMSRVYRTDDPCCL